MSKTPAVLQTEIKPVQIKRGEAPKGEVDWWKKPGDKETAFL